MNRSQLAIKIAGIIGGEHYKTGMMGVTVLAELKQRELEAEGKDLGKVVEDQIAIWRKENE